MTRRTEADRPRSDGSARRWALAGAAWGLVSFLLDFGGLFIYEGILYRLGGDMAFRALGLLVPTQWLRSLSARPDGFMEYWPIWAFLAFNVLWSVILSTLAALGLRFVVQAVKRWPRSLRGESESQQRTSTPRDS